LKGVKEREKGGEGPRYERTISLFNFSGVFLVIIRKLLSVNNILLSYVKLYME
jgi:hypothetical protein